MDKVSKIKFKYYYEKKGLHVECDGDCIIKVFSLVDLQNGQIRLYPFSQAILNLMLVEYISDESTNETMARRILIMLGELDGRGGVRKNAGRKSGGPAVKSRGLKMYDDEYDKLKRLGGLQWIREQLDKFD